MHLEKKQNTEENDFIYDQLNTHKNSQKPPCEHRYVLFPPRETWVMWQEVEEIAMEYKLGREDIDKNNNTIAL